VPPPCWRFHVGDVRAPVPLGVNILAQTPGFDSGAITSGQGP
jgi:hypothetical protein